MIVGRESELHRIDAVLATARGGEAGAIVVRGEPGMGKTTLLEQAIAGAEGFRVLRAVGVESEAELACAGLHQLLRPLLDRVDELPAPQAAALRAALALDASGETDRFAVYLGTLGLIAAAAEGAPLLCVVDDAHWLDALSAEALVFAARRLHAEPVAMLFAARTGERRFPAASVPDVELGPLDEDASKALVEASERSVPAVAVASLVRVAGGNPLALLELPRSLSSQQLLDAAASDEPVPVSRAIEEAFLARVRALSAEARRVLVLAAASGLSGLGALLDDEALASALDEAERAGLVRLEGAVVHFRHPLVRAAAYQAATGAERRRAHAALAAAMPRESDGRAWHLAAATGGQDDEVAALLEAVADRAGQRGATAARARALARAAELTTARPVRCRRLLDGARAAFVAGHGSLARALVDQASELADDAVLRADAAYVRWHGQAADSAELYPSYLHAAEAVAPLDARRAARMFSAASDYLFAATRFDESIPLVERAWVLLERQLIPGYLGVASDVAWLRLSQGKIDEAVELAAGALEVGEHSDEREDLEELGFAAIVLAEAEDPRARPMLQALIHRMRTRGTLPGLCLALSALGQLERRTGRLRAAYAAAVEHWTLGEMIGSWSAFWGATNLAILEGTLGRREACAHLAALAAPIGPSDDRMVRATTLGAMGLAALANGELETARRELEEALSIRPPIQLDWPGPQSRTDLAEVLIRLGDRRGALALLEAFERDRAAFATSLAAARRCRVLAAPDAEVEATATHALAEIDGRWPFEEARTRLVYGERLRRAGRRIDAREQLQQALRLFEQLGGEAWAERTRSELRASGATVGHRDVETANLLTPQELRVALAVAGGKTNREVGAALFISPKTVELHLSRVYRKLGISSRAQLAHLHGAEPARLVHDASV